ncbi:putative fibroblast growth factor 1 isoform X3 [Zootermopsis nevadensis]|uniref:putative fibroblast growth factor 1 isoform X3 n=1 Tax=Zootermopsis nevadensis TaxID=136037 RepID=UPI000B8E8770|nr:putative fibroblast growth factor 1 isoform X3 [Zootermopsis nevadensis]
MSLCVCLSPGSSTGRLNLPSRPGNPVYGPRMQLHCRTGFHIGIFADGKVRGIDRDLDDFALLEVSTISPDEVKIQGVKSKLYLAMDRNGRLYGEVDVNEEGTIFVASLLGYYNTYLSRKYAHLGWYVGIKKSGKPKRGSKTKWGQKAIQFLPRRLEL